MVRIFSKKISVRKGRKIVNTHHRIKNKVGGVSYKMSTDILDLDQEEDKFIRFRWLHGEKNEYFEFSIEKTEISNQTILVIKDFAEKNEIKDQSQLWGYQVKDLFHRIGS